MKLVNRLLPIIWLLTIFNGSAALAAPPMGWSLNGDPDPSKGYSCDVDDSVRHDAKPSALLKSTKPTNGFATMMQTVSARNYVEKRIRFSGLLKLEDVDASCGLWVRIDGPTGTVLDMDKMSDRALKGTSDWKECSVVLDVPMEAKKIAIGVILEGNGKVWVTDLKFETVGKDVATTSRFNILSPNPVNLELRAK